MTIPQSELHIKIGNVLTDQIDSKGHSDFEVLYEARPSEVLPPMNSQKELTNTSFISDFMIVKDIDWTPPELDNLENVQRWFPTDSIKVPVTIIEIENKVEFIDIREENIKLKDLRLWNISQKYDGVLGMLINYDSVESIGWDERDSSGSFGASLGTSMRRGDFILQIASEIDNDWIDESIVAPIMDHLELLDDRMLIDTYSLEDIVNDFDPSVYHFNEVLNAYRNNRKQVLVILLSVFFEAYVNELVANHVSKLKDNPHARDFYQDWNFHSSLDACRFFGILEDSEYELINKVRKARNIYAHDFEEYHAHQETQLEQEGKIDDAVKLYEKLIGVKSSMVE